MTRILIWWLCVCISALFIGYTQYMFDGWNYVVQTDKTNISFLIMGIYLLCSAIIGVMIYTKSKIPYGIFWYVCALLPRLGLFGTVLGLAITSNVFQTGISIDNLDSISTAIGQGFGAALTTTICGLAFALLLEFQLVILEYQNDE